MLKIQRPEKKPKALLAATGLTAEEFEALLSVLGERYTIRFGEEQKVEGKTRQRRAGALCGRQAVPFG